MQMNLFLVVLSLGAALHADTQLRGGVSARGEASLEEIYADQDPLRGKPAILPPALEGRVRRCIPPDRSWALVRETPSTCYYFVPFPNPLPAVVVTVEEAQRRRMQGGRARCGSHPWNLDKQLCDEEGPPLSGEVITTVPPGPSNRVPPTWPGTRPPSRTRPPSGTVPPSGPRLPPGSVRRPPPANPGYLDGIRDGFHLCGKPFETMWRAYQALERGDAVSAANILGGNRSDAGVRFIGSALQALWADLAETQVLDQTGRPVTGFEKGRRHALRIFTLGPDSGRRRVRDYGRQMRCSPQKARGRRAGLCRGRGRRDSGGEFLCTEVKLASSAVAVAAWIVAGGSEAL